MIKFVETTDIPLSKLENNNGQIEGLPKNPRYVRDYRFEQLVENIKKHPDMLALRELMVYQHGDKYIVYGGNMRLKALREIGYKSAPCKIIPPETPIDEIRAYIILDNNPFGEWDTDILANEWDESELVEWGMELPETNFLEEEPTDLDGEDKNKPFAIKITFESDEKLNEFRDKYEKIIQDEFKVIISVSGGEL